MAVDLEVELGNLLEQGEQLDDEWVRFFHGALAEHDEPVVEDEHGDDGIYTTQQSFLVSTNPNKLRTTHSIVFR